MDDAALVRAYYRSIDAGAYDDLAALLASDFVQVRPDRTFDGRDRFVRFMREERPRFDTEHAVAALYGGRDGIAAAGRLCRGEDVLFDFVDAFTVEDGRLARLVTYTR